MRIEYLNQDDEWVKVAFTGNNPYWPVKVTRLYELNTVIEFENTDSSNPTRFRVFIPDRILEKVKDKISTGVGGAASALRIIEQNSRSR